MVRFPILLAMASAVLVSTPAAGRIRETPSGSTRPAGSRPVRLPLLFVENRGQVDPEVTHYLRARGIGVYFTPRGLTWALSGEGRRWAVRQEFVGARPGVRPVAGDRRETVFSWFRGPREKWKTGVPTFGTLTYPRLWPGIDMICSAEPERLKSLFRVEPGADPARIRFAYRGAGSVRLTPSGSLRVDTRAGGFEDAAPIAFQERDGRRIPVEAAYLLDEAPDGDGAVVCSFRVGAMDPTLPLLLDPSVALYAGFVGGTGYDAASCVALDGEGNACVAGTTDSAESTFPLSVGPDLTLNAAPPDIYGRRHRDAFVAKVRADGTGLLYCGYIGGDSEDGATAIAVDAAGNACVAGYTYSSEGTFPLAVGPDLSRRGYSFEAFVGRVRADGTALDYCGYVDSSEVNGIAVDGAGNAYIAGRSGGVAAIDPVAVGPELSSYGGQGDAFVAKIRADGSGFAYRGYIGGDGSDYATAIAVDAAGNAYVAGGTSSGETTFPVAVGPSLQHHAGSDDAFVAKVRADGSGLDYCGYIGGDYSDVAYGIAVDGGGNAYVTGNTSSPEDSFPVAVGPSLTINADDRDAFVAKVRADGTGLDYCGYVGGGDFDLGRAIAVDSAGRACIAGLTDSTEATFPVVEGPSLTSVGGWTRTYLDSGAKDAFVARVAPDGSPLEYCGFLRGSGFRFDLGIAVDSSGSACVAGSTATDGSPFPASVGPGLAARGGGDAFVVRIPVDFPPEPARSLGLSLNHGLLRATSSYWRDSLSIRGSFSVEGEPFPDGADPRAGGLGFEFANPWTINRLRIPADDPGWRESGRGVFTWKSPRRSFPKWRVRIDSERGTFDIRTSKDDLGYDWRIPVTVYLSIGGASGTVTRRWERPGKGYGRLRFPRGGSE